MLQLALILTSVRMFDTPFIDKLKILLNKSPLKNWVSESPGQYFESISFVYPSTIIAKVTYSS